jgi:hypothetical protein
VLRLASLLWRLRRATTMETALFEIHADCLSEIRQARQTNPASREIVNAMFGRTNLFDFGHDSESPGVAGPTPPPETRSKSVGSAVDPAADFARCLLRLANLPNYALDRLSRYEATLWRQVGQTPFALDALDRRKPQDRGSRFRIGS